MFELLNGMKGHRVSRRLEPLSIQNIKRMFRQAQSRQMRKKILQSITLAISHKAKAVSFCLLAKCDL